MAPVCGVDIETFHVTLESAANVQREYSSVGILPLITYYL